MKDTNIIIEELPGENAASIVDPFYEKFGFKGRAREKDLFFIARIDTRLVGAVRFCVEDDTPMLRTMMIDAEFRRHGIGYRLLCAFAEYLDTNNVRNVFCIPYIHLQDFYGKIGFRLCQTDVIPAFLTARLAEYNTLAINNICMKRP